MFDACAFGVDVYTATPNDRFQGDSLQIDVARARGVSDVHEYTSPYTTWSPWLIVGRFTPRALRLLFLHGLTVHIPRCPLGVQGESIYATLGLGSPCRFRAWVEYLSQQQSLAACRKA